MVLVFFFFGGLPDPDSELVKVLSLFLFSLVGPMDKDFFELGAVVLEGGVLIMLVSTIVPPSFLNLTLLR